MADTLKKNKSKDSLIEEYLNCITDKCSQTIPSVKKPMKVDDDQISIPTINTYNNLVYYNYNLTQLKNFAKNYKLKISGNKKELFNRLYSYLYFSSYAIKIQKIFRGNISRQYKRLRGPAILNRQLCTNSDDFVSMEPVSEIPYHQFLSYKDTDGFVYGFDITSLHTMLQKNGKETRNPYNRNEIPVSLISNLKSLIKLGKLLNIDINLDFEDDSTKVSFEKAIELKIIGLFQQIDALGNYSNANWFLSLNQIRLSKFVKELEDIWNYRSQLTPQMKRNICHPNGDPFRNLSIHYVQTESNIWNVRKVVFDILDRFVNSGVDKDSKALGAYYVLGALTIVNSEAATSLPWLFQSFSLF